MSATQENETFTKVSGFLGRIMYALGYMDWKRQNLYTQERQVSAEYQLRFTDYYVPNTILKYFR